MASVAWSKEEKELLKAYRPTHTISECHAEFKRHKFNRSRKAIERKCANMGIVFIGKPIVSKGEDKSGKVWQAILSIKEKYKDSDLVTKGRGLVRSKDKLRKILCLSDFHIPFDRDDLIRQAIKDHADADILVINGDLLDLHAVSTWPKEKTVALRNEYDIAVAYMKLFSTKFPRVILVRGNHEFRLNRYFYKNVNPAVNFLVNKEILGHIASGNIYDDDGNIVKKLDFGNITYQPGPEAWFFKVGKTMFVHPLSFSRVDGKTGVMAWEYFMDREDIDSVVVSHTHHQLKLFKKGRMVIENGCLCIPLDYSKQGKLSYGPQTLGYAVIYQDSDGNTDFNLSNIVFKGIQYPTKKSFEDLELEEAKSK